MGGDLNFKKDWHTQKLSNIKIVWEREQKVEEEEKRKLYRGVRVCVRAPHMPSSVHTRHYVKRHSCVHSTTLHYVARRNSVANSVT